MNKLEAELQPCIFCGARAEFKKVHEKRWVSRYEKVGGRRFGLSYIKCTQCKAKTHTSMNIEKLIHAWNTGRIFPANENALILASEKERARRGTSLAVDNIARAIHTTNDNRPRMNLAGSLSCDNIHVSKILLNGDDFIS